MMQKEPEFRMFGDQLREHPEQRIPGPELHRIPQIIKGRRVFVAPLSEAGSFVRLDKNPDYKQRVILGSKTFYNRQRSMFHQKNNPLTQRVNEK